MAGATGDDDVNASFVGRARERAQLHAWLAEVAGGAPVTVMLSGDSGLGKSALLTRFVEEIAGSATVLSGACMNLDGVFPYAPLIDALRRWRRSEGEQSVRALAGPAWSEVSGLIADFTGQEMVDGALDSKRKVFGALSRMLEHIGWDAPVVLIFEDLQWADLATLDLVAFLTQAAPVDRLMLVGTYRPGLEAEHRLREMLAEPEFIRRIRQMPLSGLSSGEIGDLLRSRGHEVDSGELRRYAELTNGNPYYVTQLDDAGGPTDHVPPSLAKLLLARIRRLGDDAHEVVRVVAVAGRRVSDPLLARVCNLREEPRERAIEDCLERDILILDRPDDAYRFQNPLLGDSIHDTLQASVRTRMHLAMAAALTDDPHLGLSAPLEVAYHWFEAKSWPNALAAGVRAGTFAAQMSAFPEAETYYSRVLDLWSRVGNPEQVAGTTRRQVLAAAADAARWAGRIDVAISRLRQAIAEIDPIAAPQRAAELYERLGSYLWEANASGADSQDTYVRALDLLRDQPPSAIRARVLAAMATGSARAGRYDEAYAQADAALTEARAVGARAEEGRALNSAGLALTMLDKVEDGIASLQDAVAIADEVGHLEDLLRAYGNLGLAQEHAGRLGEAVATLQTALDRVKALGLFDTRQRRVLTNNLSANLVLSGDWDVAVELLEEIVADRPVEESAYQRLTLAEIYVACGRFTDAQGLLNELRGLPGVEPRFVGALYSCLAELALWQGNPASARTTVDNGLAALAGTQSRIVLMQVYAIGLRATANEARLVSRSGPGRGRRSADASTEPQAEARAGRTDLRSAADTLMSLARETVPVDRSLREIAVLARLCDAEHARVGEADTEQMWRQVAADWDALGRPYPAAYARWRLAEAGVRDKHRADAARAAQAALAAAKDLGAAPLAAGIERSMRDHRLTKIPLTDGQAGATESNTPAHPADEFGLSGRELQVLELAVEGLINDAIGRRLGIAGNTVGVHLAHVYDKMRVAGRAQAVAIAITRGFFAK